MVTPNTKSAMKSSTELGSVVEDGTRSETISGRPVQTVYSCDDLANFDYDHQLGPPGSFPFTRGVHANMYRGRLWTMRQFAGFGTAKQTNDRFRFLLDQGQNGLSVAFDMPTLMGLDSDDPQAEGEVGRLGVAVDTVEDIQQLFDGIDLGAISTSMTINAPAAMTMAFYLVAAERQGVAWNTLRGTIQNDILKEFHAQNEFVFPPVPSMRLVADVVEFCCRHVPQWNPISISGYHIREAGSTAGQELAFTLADGLAYVDATLKRGLGIDEFAPRLSFFFNAHNDFFEEIAKYRAARRIWARRMHDHYGALEEDSWRLRFHAQTAGCTLQAAQPEVNLIRVAYQGLAAVLGGCQSLHTNSMDETLGLPTEHAVTLALRTQQVLAHETGVANTVDPLGGSYCVESLTNQLEEEAEEYFQKIQDLGGVLAGIDSGFFRREIADASDHYQRQVDAKQRTVVGVNEFVQPERLPIALHRIDPKVERHLIDRLTKTKAERDAVLVRRCLDQIRDTARGSENLMPAFLNAARNQVTVGEMMSALVDVFDRFRGGNAWW